MPFGVALCFDTWTLGGADKMEQFFTLDQVSETLELSSCFFIVV